MKRFLWFLLICLPTVVNSQTIIDEVVQYHLTLTLNGRYVNGDSGDVVGAYPCSGDTTGKRQDLVWVGGPRYAWRFEPDSTWCYDIKARASCCSDTTLTEVSSRIWDAGDVAVGAIDNANAFSTGIVSLALAEDPTIDLGQSDTTGVFEVDTLRAIHLEALSSFSVQPGNPGVFTDDLFYVDDAAFTLRGIDGHFEDNVQIDTNLNVDGTLDVDGTMTAGTLISDVHTFNGTVDTSNDVDAQDDVIAGDNVTAVDDVIAGENVTATLTVTGADLAATDDLTVGNYADVADSLAAGTSYTAADSLAANVVMVNGFPVVNVYPFTMGAGTLEVVVKVPGARPWDTTAIPINTSSTVGATYGLVTIRCVNNGELRVLRAASTNSQTFLLIPVKYR